MRKSQYKSPLRRGLTALRVKHERPKGCGYTLISGGVRRRQDLEIYHKPLNQLFIETVWFYFPRCSTTAVTVTAQLSLSALPLHLSSPRSKHLREVNSKR